MGCNFVTMQLCCAYCRNIKCSHQWVTAYIERSLLASNTESTSVTKNIFIRDKLFRHKYVMLQIMTPPKYQRKVAHVSSIVRPVDREFMERRYRESYWDRNMNTHLTKLAHAVSLFFISAAQPAAAANIAATTTAAAALLFTVTYPRL